jgi:hypothetical protein
MIKLSNILSIIFEQEINKDKIFPFLYTGVRKNDIDDSGESVHTYTFDSPLYEYSVYFVDMGGGFYERVFGTVERNLAPTKENVPYTIYRTVTAITLDFLDRMSRKNEFDTLIIEPISSQRRNIVKKFLETYISPKYNIKDDGYNITIKKK